MELELNHIELLQKIQQKCSENAPVDFLPAGLPHEQLEELQEEIQLILELESAGFVELACIPHEDNRSGRRFYDGCLVQGLTPMGKRVLKDPKVRLRIEQRLRERVLLNLYESEDSESLSELAEKLQLKPDKVITILEHLAAQGLVELQGLEGDGILTPAGFMAVEKLIEGESEIFVSRRERSVAIGGDVMGGVVVTGDGNTIHFSSPSPEKQSPDPWLKIDPFKGLGSNKFGRLKSTIQGIYKFFVFVSFRLWTKYTLTIHDIKIDYDLPKSSCVLRNVKFGSLSNPIEKQDMFFRLTRSQKIEAGEVLNVYIEAYFETCEELDEADYRTVEIRFDITSSQLTGQHILIYKGRLATGGELVDCSYSIDPVGT